MVTSPHPPLFLFDLPNRVRWATAFRVSVGQAPCNVAKTKQAPNIDRRLVARPAILGTPASIAVLTPLAQRAAQSLFYNTGLCIHLLFPLPALHNFSLLLQQTQGELGAASRIVVVNPLPVADPFSPEVV